MQDAAWAIVLFGGIPATLIFLFWWICRRDLREYFPLVEPNNEVVEKADRLCRGQVAAQTKFCGLQVEPQEQVSDFKKAQACPGLLCSQ